MQTLSESVKRAIAATEISSVKVNASLQVSPWSTNCFLATVSLQFDYAGAPDSLCIAAFVAPPSATADYNRAYEKAAVAGHIGDDRKLVTALAFALKDKVQCVHADLDLLDLALDLGGDQRLDGLRAAMQSVVNQSSVSAPSVKVRNRVVQEIADNHRYLEKRLVRQAGRITVSSQKWFF